MKHFILYICLFIACSLYAQRPEIHYNGEELAIGPVHYVNPKYPLSIQNYKGLRWNNHGLTFTMEAKSNGLYIGTSAGSIDIYDTESMNYGTIRCSGFYVISDGAVKENIEPIENLIPIIERIGNINQTKTKSRLKDGQVISSDPLLEMIREYFPNTITTGANGETLVNYVELVPLLVRSLQELQTTAREQHERIGLLKLKL